MTHLFVNFITWYLLIQCTYSLTVFADGNNTEYDSVTIQYYDATRDVFESVFTNLTGEIVLGTEDKNVEGKIAVVPFNYGADVIALGLRERGAIGMIMGSTSSFLIGRAGYLFTVPRRSDWIIFPSVTISEEDFLELSEKLEKNDENLNYTVSMTSDLDVDNPYYDTMMALGPFATVLLALSASATILLSFFILALDIAGNQHTCKIGIKSILIVLILLWNILKLMFSLADFEGHSRQSGWVIVVFYQMVNIPLSIICILLLSLFWFETLGGVLTEKTKSFSATRIPFAILIFLYLVLIIIVIVMANAAPFLLHSILSFVAAFYSLSWIALSVFHLVMSCQVDAMLKKISKTRKAKHVKSFLVKIVIISILDLFCVFLLLTIVAIPVWSTPFSSVFAIVLYNFITGISPILVLSLFNWNIKAIRLSSSRSKSKRTIESKE